MALKYATKSGNWSDSTVWNGGTLPQSGDTVHANNFTVTVDQDVNVSWLSTAASTPAVAGGGFSVTNNSGTRTINAELRGGTTTCVTMSGTGTLAVVGTISGGATDNTYALLTTAASTITITGDISPTLGAAYGISTTSTGTLTVTGNVNGNSNANRWSISGTFSSVTVNGNVNGMTPSVAANTISLTGATSVTINGNITGSTGNTAVVNVTSGAAITVTGTCKGGSGSACYGLLANNANAIIDLQGQVEAGSGGAGAYLIGPTSIKAKGPFIHHSGTSRVPLVATHWAVYANTNTSWTVMNDTSYPAGSAVVLTNYTTNSPSPANVRYGTVYGPSNNLTGTMVVPAATSVASGVAVDNTTGSAVINGSSLSSIVGAQIQAGMNQ